MTDENQAADTQDNTNGEGGEAEGSSTIATGEAEGSDKEAAGEEEGSDTSGQEEEGQEEEGQEEKEEKDEGGELDTEAFTLPENYGEVDKESIEEFAVLAKRDGLSQEKAQEYMDLATKAVIKEREGQLKYWKDSKNKWEADVKVDPELGGISFKETNARAQRAVRTLNDPQLTAFLADGFGNHPSIVRALVKYDKLTSSAPPVDGEGPGPEKKSTAKTLFPDHN
jgi:hypothetical protein